MEYDVPILFSEHSMNSEIITRGFMVSHFLRDYILTMNMHSEFSELVDSSHSDPVCIHLICVCIQYAVRLFESRGFEFLLAQSYAKNLGLYGERAGCASVICGSPQAAKAVMSQLCGVIRPMYSNPPAHGARIVKKVLGDAKV